MALPRRTLAFHFGLRPWFGLCPKGILNANIIGAQPEPGAEPKPGEQFTARQSHRLTSGGKAVTQTATGNRMLFRALPQKSDLPRGRSVLVRVGLCDFVDRP